jgi:hypothetical protein
MEFFRKLIEIHARSIYTQGVQNPIAGILLFLTPGICPRLHIQILEKPRKPDCPSGTREDGVEVNGDSRDFVLPVSGMSNRERSQVPQDGWPSSACGESRDSADPQV